MCSENTSGCSLEKAQAQKTVLKCNNSRYSTTNVALGVIAAVLAGTMGKAETWKQICLFAATYSVGATVTAKLQTTDQLTDTSQGVGQLKALRFEIVLLNACQIGRTGYALTGVSRFAQAFLNGGAGAFVGTLWSVVLPRFSPKPHTLHFWKETASPQQLVKPAKRHKMLEMRLG